MHLFINEQSVEWHGLLACFVGFEKAFPDSVNMQEHLVKNIGGSWSPFKIEEDSKVDALREQLCCSVEQDLLQRSCLFSVASDADAVPNTKFFAPRETKIKAVLRILVKVNIQSKISMINTTFHADCVPLRLSADCPEKFLARLRCRILRQAWYN